MATNSPKIEFHSKMVCPKSKQQIRNIKAKEKQFQNRIAISINNFSFANSLTIEVLNPKVVGKVDQKYRAAASAFQSLSELEFLLNSLRNSHLFGPSTVKLPFT
jgi:hypothetical protein